MKYQFNAPIYKTGINWAVDVPAEITGQMIAIKGYIRITGTINGFQFRKSLVPVKKSYYRLFVNLEMMKGGKTSVGETAYFELRQDFEPKKEVIYEIPDFLKEFLITNKLDREFGNLTAARKRDILRYLHNIKSPEVRQKNLEKLGLRLKSGIRDVRIP